MRKILCLLFLFLFLLFPAKSFAADNFSSDYNVTYTIQDNASTHVRIDVVMTNLSSRYYASSYKIQLGFKDISNIKAADAGGTINPDVIKNSKGSTVDLVFNKKVVGEGSKLSFNLSFDTPEVAQNQGNLWEINIPGLSQQNDFSSFNAKVIVPANLGKPSYIKPMVGDNPNRQVGNQLNFTKSELGTSGISIAFGEYQVYDFNLKYHLGNKNLFPVTTEIALPPSTNYQDVLINTLTPRPTNVRIDKDGNWLAEYYLLPSAKKDIIAKGSVKIFLKPKKEALPKEQEKEYLKEKPFWQTSNGKIKNLAKDLRTPGNIYEYVVDNLSYDFSRVTAKKARLGAVDVLADSTSAVCLEFTDLFIALARSAGIPAREINGYGVTRNQHERPLSLDEDILHSWPEYYDYEKQTWIMVDPTWGNTTGGVDYFNVLDFDHFAFVRKGSNSTYPVPAGGYKVSSSKSKDVNVVVGKSFELNKSLKMDAIFPTEVLAGLPITADIKVENVGNTITDPHTLIASTDYLSPKSQILLMNQIPPFGKITIPLNYKKTPILTRRSDTVKIQVDKNPIYKDVSITPFYLNKWFILGGVLIAGLSIVIFIIVRGIRSLFVLRQK